MRKIFIFILLIFTIVRSTGQDSIVPAQDAKPPAKIGYAGLPLISLNKSRGFGFGVLGMMFFKIGDSANKLSRIVAIGEYTTKNNWLAAGFSQLSLDKDKLRINFGGGYMNSNFQFYEDIGAETFEVPYNNYGAFGFASALYNIFDRVYIGPSVQISESSLVIETPVDSTSTTYQNSIGLSFQYDNRNDIYTSSKGMNTTIRYAYFGKWFMNDYNFNKLNISINYYFPINEKMVLASRFAADIALGSNVPFVQQSYVGNRDIRGYTKGEYRGNQVYAAQSELRWNFYGRWGCVGFFGLALTQNPDEWSQLLPGIGTGLRYKILKSMNINLGGDIAFGKDDWGLYLRITEAF